MVKNHVLNVILLISHKLRDFHQPKLSPKNLRRFANIVYAESALIHFCLCFIDGAVRSICRPEQHQRVFIQWP